MMNTLQSRTIVQTNAIQEQTGSALVISLIMLLIISLLAIGGLRSTILQERMSANLHDRELAFQAAEAALRAGERFLVTTPPNTITNSNGLYDINNAAVPDWLGPAASVAATGAFELTPELASVARQPQYFIERIGITPPGTETEIGTAKPPVSFYRITARGFGGTDDSVVVVSSVFRNQ
ncbi:pilus assembly PilX family protein [Saccharospirillum alexandrii]|uniref:pilus assembly PilX family protein n=1 Tax=Saccharospirillum alexandrii TaxID=2448477 RepID=UPI000FDBF7E6|nr:PilX N-terminal domain-containing pilus assembly protein [Saccharospirillum alexandrii]